MNPKISVIIPVYNAAEYIKRCIDSILAQNYSNLEIICINDGSTDKSLSVLQNLAQTNSCIKVISQKNMGAAIARNVGIEYASGDYISFIDADDTIEKCLYENFANIVKNSNLDIFMFNGNIICNDSVSLFFTSNLFHQDVKEYDVFDYTKIKNFFYGNQSVCNKIYRTEFLRSNNIKFVANSCFEDTHFYFISLIKAKKISFTYKSYYNYHSDNVGSVTKSFNTNAFTLFDLYSAMEKEVKELNLWNFFCYALFQLEYEKSIEVLRWISDEFKEKFYLKAQSFLKERISALNPNIYMQLVNIMHGLYMINYSYDQFKNSVLLTTDTFHFQTKKYSNPLISVIIPIHNVKQFLPTCLKSVVNQTFKNFEVICVNDGSTDGSEELIQECVDKDSRFNLINQKNHGLGHARNTAIKKAKGKYLVFLDSDDWLSVDALQKISEKILKHHPDLGTFGVYEYLQNTLQMLSRNYILRYKDIDVSDWHTLKDYFFFMPAVWLRFYNRKFFLENNLMFNENAYFEDVPVSIKAMLKAKNIVVCHNNLYFYRIRNNSIMHSEYSEKKVKDLITSLSDTYKVIVNEGAWEELKVPLAMFSTEVLNMHIQKAGEHWGKLIQEQVKTNDYMQKILQLK